MGLQVGASNPRRRRVGDAKDVLVDDPTLQRVARKNACRRQADRICGRGSIVWRAGRRFTQTVQFADDLSGLPPRCATRRGHAPASEPTRTRQAAEETRRKLGLGCQAYRVGSTRHRDRFFTLHHQPVHDVSASLGSILTHVEIKNVRGRGKILHLDRA